MKKLLFFIATLSISSLLFSSFQKPIHQTLKSLQEGLGPNHKFSQAFKRNFCKTLQKSLKDGPMGKTLDEVWNKSFRDMVKGNKKVYTRNN